MAYISLHPLFFYLIILTIVLFALLYILFTAKVRKRKNLSSLNKLPDVKTDKKEDSEKKTLSSKIDLHTDTRREKLCQDIQNMLINEKMYRNPALSRDDMIAQLGTNKTLFIEAFQHCFGTTFPTCINNLRLKDSLYYLEKTDFNIEEISEKSGFGSVRTFYRQFQDKYNMSPAEFRKKNKH